MKKIPEQYELNDEDIKRAIEAWMYQNYCSTSDNLSVELSITQDIGEDGDIENQELTALVSLLPLLP